MILNLEKFRNRGRYAAIVDVGSGSVGVAIVLSETSEDKPQIIWSYRERVPVREKVSFEDSLDQITATILNTFLKIGSTGGPALKTFDSKAVIEIVRVTISAPWSYTITKNITLSQEKKFSVTPKLVAELGRKATEQAKKIMNTAEAAKKLSLELISSETVNISVNGYPVKTFFARDISKVTLSHLTGAVDVRMIKAIREAQEKVLPDAELMMNTFMFAYYKALQNLHPNTTEVCLVDVTAKATELGIIRDSVLVHATHTPQGMYTIASEISDLCKIPKEEALGYFKDNGVNLETSLAKDKLVKISAIRKSYEDNLSELFHLTGDALSIPKTIFLHTDIDTEKFFSDCVKNAAKEATGINHSIHPVTSQLVSDGKSSDTAILLSTYVFHKKLYNSDYLQE